mgnify:CR=1 FL=1
MSDPLRDIEVLEQDGESWWLAYWAALELQDRVEREQGSACQRILRSLPAPVVVSKPAPKPPRWRYG